MNVSDKTKLEYLENLILGTELLNCILGDKIGSGMTRDVFQHPHFDDQVVKVEYQNNGDNWAEWRVWKMVEHTDHKKWFAECSWISSNGLVLIQKKTEDFYERLSKAPKHVPKYFTDIKPDNMGWIKNQLTFHDYSFCLDMFASKGGLTKGMQKLKLNKWI